MIPAAGLTALVASTDVLTEKAVFMNVCAVGFVIPAIDSSDGVFDGSTQEPPERVTVTVVVTVDPTAVQLRNPAPRMIAGEAGDRVGPRGRRP